MTCIVYRNGVMAGDSRAYGGDKVPIGSKCKIRRLTDGTLIGATSTEVGGTHWAMDWYEAGCPAQPGKEVLLPDKFTMLAVKPDGSGFMANNAGVLSGPLKAPYFAIGSGEEYALGAMAYSELCNAVSAVQAACVLDVWSDLPIYAASHSGDMPKMVLDIDPDKLIWLKG